MLVYSIDNMPNNHKIESKPTEKDSKADTRNVMVWLYACSMVVCMCIIRMKGKGCLQEA